MRGSRGGEQGQATLEFALTMILLMAFILFFIQLSLVFAWGNYVHYATFMSARAYLSAGPDQIDQKERASNVITAMLKKGAAGPGIDRLPFVAKGVGDGDVAGASIGEGSNFSPRERAQSWAEGVRYTFKSKLFLTPLGGASGAGANSLTLTSESWLGREPTYSECQSQMKDLNGVIDNGC